MYATLGCKVDGSLGCGKVVAAIYAFEGRVVARLHAILYAYIFVTRQRGKVIQFLLIYAVGTCADYYSCDLRMRECLVVAGLQSL